MISTFVRKVPDKLLRRGPRAARHGEQGAVIVMVALGLVALLGAVGMGLDSARLLEERRAAQGAVDHAAAAAAFSSCSGNDAATAIADGEAAALRNGYDDDGATNTVTVSVVGGPPHQYVASITAVVPGSFSRVLGFTTFDVSVEGTAGGEGCGSGLGSPGAIYAGGTCPIPGKYGLDVSGSSTRIIGGIHSNDDVHIGGTSNVFTDPVLAPAPDTFTHVGSINPGAGNTFEPGYPQAVPAPVPAWLTNWAPGDVTGGGGSPPTAGSLLRAYYDLADANGTMASNDTLFSTEITEITKDGVYYTTHASGMNISNVTGSVRNVVLVAPNGPIKVSVSGKTLNAITDVQLDAITDIPVGLNLPRANVLMLSNFIKPADKNCEEYTIHMSGSGMTWKGIIWAPGGQIEWAGSANDTVNGSLVGWAVKLNGSSLRINNTGAVPPADPTVVFIK